MAKTWLSIDVELLSGRGNTLWPRPGRSFLVGPSHTFADLAGAINTAFARWDLAHLSVFTLADGRTITDEESAEEFAASEFGPLQETLDFTRVKVTRTVKPGDEFRFTFDLGDDWTHKCVVAASKVDPVAMFGETPRRLVAHWGWGAMPDQYGRRWPNDDGTEATPPEPKTVEPMAGRFWPDDAERPFVDARDLRAATAARDVDRLVAALLGRQIDEALQLSGAGLSMALDRDRDKVETMALSVVNRLTFRGFPGDSELSAALLAKLRNEPAPGRDLDVDIEMLSMVHEGSFDESDGGYIDLETGDVIDAMVVDYGDADIDVSEDPDRWARFDRAETRDAWKDMEAFVSGLRDPEIRDRGLMAIEGTGAFRRFRRFTDDHDLGDRWMQFSDDRKYGRARLILAENGIRVV
ncbi:UPF0158 family protein [Brevibacterium spongiae]|uniref:UPF0158 family protein n=1 Tax=Brevibacterium spongiae TaxID=2909672 RepID=A0ABY5SMQ8_9MICO|nr:UPF0158 family protein [Brevibacterium spongiae]UVI35752.1 UPF0158 family protein [Brevibacterium spongiae]